MDRHPPEARLETDQATVRGGQPDRAADIGADVEGSVPRRGRGAGAGARPRRIPVESPGVSRDAVDAGQAGRQHAVVGHGGLAEDHAPGLAHAGGRRRIGGGGRRVLVGAGADRRRVAARVDVLLDGDGHAVEGGTGGVRAPARLRRPRRRERPVAVHAVHRVEPRLPQVDAREQGSGDLDGRQGAAGVGGRQLGGGQLVDGGHGPMIPDAGTGWPRPCAGQCSARQSASPVPATPTARSASGAPPAALPLRWLSAALVARRSPEGGWSLCDMPSRFTVDARAAGVPP